MSKRTRFSDEQTALALSVLSGDGTPGQAQELDALLRDNPALVSQFVDLVGQEAWLGWSCFNQATSPLGFNPAGQLTNARTGASTHLSPARRGRWARSQWQRWAALAIAASLLLATGAVMGVLWAPARGPIAMSGGRGADDPVAASGDYASSDYSAKIVDTSACRWSPSVNYAGGVAGVGGPLRRGESVNLLEGLATVRLETAAAAADLSIEGPASMVLTADGGCSVSYGLVTAKAQAVVRPFVINTPSLEVSIGREASVGLSVEGREVEVHVFDGDASVVVPWGTGQLDSQQYTLRGGESLTLQESEAGKYSIARGASNRQKFATRTSMEEDHLTIGQAYIDSVLSQNPLIYWRFDGSESGAIPNLAGDRYAGKIVGTLRQERGRGNRYINFAGGISKDELDACVMSDGPIDFGDSQGYSLEMWIKPSHYHHGSLAAMYIDRQVMQAHGALLEIGGPYAPLASIEEPGRFRFLHRSPPGDDVATGRSCFSGNTYRLREWQHVVAAKDDQAIRLYVDGDLVASTPDTTQVVSGMQLLIGKIDYVRQLRQFVGQLDEFALYPSALPLEVVKQHYELAKHPPEPAPQLPPATPVDIGV